MHETRLANLLGATVLNLSDRMTAAAATAAGVSLSGTAALVTLAEFPGLSGTELGQRIGLSQPACARMLDQLEARDLVRRQEKTGRAVAVVLTRTGHAAAARALRARQEVLTTTLTRLAARERTALEPVLESMLQGLRAQIGSSKQMCRLCDHACCVADDAVCPIGRQVSDG